MPAPTSKQPTNGESLTKKNEMENAGQQWGAQQQEARFGVPITRSISSSSQNLPYHEHTTTEKHHTKKGTQLQEQARPCKCTVRQIIYPLLLGIDVAPQFGTLAPVTKLARLHRRLKTTTTTPSSKYNSCLVWSNMLEDGGDQWLVMVCTSTAPCCSLHE